MFKLFKSLKKKDFIFVFAIIFLILLQVGLELKMPDYMSKITQLVETDGSQMKDILTEGAYMLSCALGSLILTVAIGYFSSRVSATLSKNIRKRLFTKVQEFNMEEMKKFSVSSLITRTTNDITHVQMFISMGLQLLVRSPIMAVWAIIKILNKGIEWSIATGIAVFVLLAVVITLMIIVLPNFKKVQKYIDDVNNVTRENLKGIRVVRAFNAEDYEKEKFESKNHALTKIQMFNQKMMSIMGPTMNLVMHSLTLSVYIIGVILIEKALPNVRIEIFSNMIVFSSYSMQVIMSFIMLTMIFAMYPRANVSAKRINEVLDTEASIKNGESKFKSHNKDSIEFKSVSFKYPDGQDYCLKNISFTAESGTTTAIIGSTGSGKTTLVNLIPRFYDITSGSLLINGKEVQDYDRESLYNNIGYVPQKAVLFSGSVYENITYGNNGLKNPNLEEVKSAAEIAQAKEFIEKMPEKYDSHISQGGTNLSGGQKQRVSIARAIARKPRIFIFDDAFSALDYKTDRKLRTELKKNMKDTINIIVATRIGTIMDADQIIVLNDGECVGIGTHSELMKKCKVYQEIAYSQLSKEELENAR